MVCVYAIFVTMVTSICIILYFFIEVELIYNAVATSPVQQSDSVIHIETFFFYILFHYGLSLDTKCAFKHISQNPLNYSHMRYVFLVSFLQTGNLSLR